MAEFDKSLDVELFGEEVDFETTKIRVSVMSYNEGRPKVQISRENFDANLEEWRWSKLGRMTKEETLEVIPLLQKALENIPE